MGGMARPMFARVQALEPRRMLAFGDLDPTFGSGGAVKLDLGLARFAVAADLKGPQSPIPRLQLALALALEINTVPVKGTNALQPPFIPI